MQFISWFVIKNNVNVHDGEGVDKDMTDAFLHSQEKNKAGCTTTDKTAAH